MDQDVQSLPSAANPPQLPAGRYRSLKAYGRALRRLSAARGRVVDSLPLAVVASPEPSPRRLGRLFPWLFFCVPMLVVALYLVLFAADRYRAESKLFVQHVAGAETGKADIGSVLTGGYAKAAEDVLYVREYVLSLDMLRHLDSTLGLRAAFGDAGLDFWYRLPKSASQERFLEYYRSRVEVLVDSNGSMLTLVTEGFTPGQALRLNQAIIAESDRFMNRLSQKMAEEHVAFAAQAVEHSRRQLDRAREALRAVQNRYGTLDPLAQAEAASKVIAEMEGKRVQLQAELRHALSYLKPDAPQVVATESTIRALEAQIAQERSKLAGDGDDRMAKAAAEYQEAKAAVDFNADLYKLALGALEGARAEATRKVKNIAVVSAPQMPQAPERPQKLLTLGTLLLILALLYGIGRLAWAVVEEHREPS